MDDNSVRMQILDAVAQTEDTAFDSLSAEVSALEAAHKFVHSQFLAAGE